MRVDGPESTRDGGLDLDQPAAGLLGRAIGDAGTENGPRSMLSFLRTLLPFTSSLSTVVFPDAPPILLHHDIPPARREMVVGAYLRGAYLLDPFYAHVCENPGTQVARLGDIQPDHFRKTEFFRSYYAHARLADEVGILVERGGGAHIFVSLGLATGAGRFTRRGHERLVHLLPVVVALLLRNWGHVPSRGDKPFEEDRSAPHVRSRANSEMRRLRTADEEGTGSRRARAAGTLVEVDCSASRHCRGDRQEPSQACLPEARHRLAVRSLRAIHQSHLVAARPRSPG